jgi:TIR domain
MKDIVVAAFDPRHFFNTKFDINLAVEHINQFFELDGYELRPTGKLWDVYELSVSQLKDFFISYNKNDKQWAEWIAWTLEEASYTVVIQEWDFRPGGNFALDMNKAVDDTQSTIAVLSENFLQSDYTAPEWAAAFARDPRSAQRKLIPVRVGECHPTGLLAQIQYVDLVGLTEETAKDLVLSALKGRAKPRQKPSFPGQPTR